MAGVHERHFTVQVLWVGWMGPVQQSPSSSSYTLKSKSAVTLYGVLTSISVNQRMTRSKPSSRLE